MRKIFYSHLLISFFSTYCSAQIDSITIYKEGALSKEFIIAVCSAAGNPLGSDTLSPYYLEQLISKAAGATYKDSLQPKLSYKWHKKYAYQLQCPATKYFEGGDFLRKVVTSGYREFANIVGPSNRLSLDLQFKDPSDSLTIREYINQKRISLEKKYDDKRFEFQQDEEWRNIMFFYFLFSEFSIN